MFEFLIAAPDVMLACSFMGLLGTLFSAMGSMAQNQAANQQADAQAAKQQEYFRQRNESLKLQQESIVTKQAQEQEVEARERLKANRETKVAQATARAAAASGGVKGASIEALQQEFDFSNVFFQEASHRRDIFGAQSADLEMRSANQQAAFDMAANNEPIERPSFAGAALRLVGGAFG